MDCEQNLLDRVSRITDSRVKDAMKYSLMAGGKRIRMKLMYAVMAGYQADPTQADDFACSLEMIHTYSLIHDDLPAMDNDTLRRGKPTCHVQYDEATAILAGDGLLTYAFQTASESPAAPELKVRCMQILAEQAGPDGMIYGQCLDTLEVLSHPDWEELMKIHRHKTGDLLAAPLMIGAVLCRQPEETVQKWKQIGYQIGLAFQIQDDILDVTESAQQLGKTNSDQRNDKTTSVTLLGKEEAEKQMNELYDKSCAMISELDAFHSDALIDLVRGIQKRNK